MTAASPPGRVPLASSHRRARWNTSYRMGAALCEQKMPPKHCTAPPHRPEPSCGCQLSPQRNRAPVGTTVGQNGVDQCAVSGHRQASQPFTLKKGILIRAAERSFPCRACCLCTGPAKPPLRGTQPSLITHKPPVSRAVDTGEIKIVAVRNSAQTNLSKK